jgi:alkylation response protein AidB-like acyl-CoA dehydrogenase
MIDLLPDADQQALVEGLARFLSDTAPLSRLRAAGTTGGEPALWPGLAALGCFGLSLGESAGGMGLGLAEEVSAFREYGARLLSPSMLAGVVAAHAADLAGAHGLRDDLVAGRCKVGIANPLAAGAVQLFDTDLSLADLALIVSESRVALCGPSAFVDASPTNGLDGVVSLHRARLVGAPMIDVEGERLPLMAMLLAAAMLAGVQRACLEQAADYARTREQFGRPIGAFQAVKHRCADMALWGEAAWSQTVYAALALDEGAPDARFHVTNAKMIAGEAALEAARATIQIHGAMGFTAAAEAHLFLKRAHLLHQLFGDPRTAARKLSTLPLML